MRIILGVALCACVFLASCSEPNSVSVTTPPAASSAGGAKIDKPFQMQVSGAECYSGKGSNAGDVAFGFPSRGPDAALKFTIGPLRDGFSPGQENNKAYAGPGDYTNVGISMKASGQKPLAGYAVITVNGDEQTGTFRMPDGTASGSWDCGHKLQH